MYSANNKKSAKFMKKKSVKKKSVKGFVKKATEYPAMKYSGSKSMEKLMASQFSPLRKSLELSDKKRESLIKGSREVVRLSKQVIYAIHRKDLADAGLLAEKMDYSLRSLDKWIDKKTNSQGAYKVAVQEFVEARAYLEFVKSGKLLSIKQLAVDSEYYLLGICDLTGELIRYAVNRGTEGKFNEVLRTREFVSLIYQNLLTFTFYGGELRKKFDQIKWDLKRLDEMVFELKVRGLV